MHKILTTSYLSWSIYWSYTFNLQGYVLQLQFFENLASISYQKKKKKKRDIHLSNVKIPEGPGDCEILNFYLGDKIKVCYFLDPPMSKL